VKFIFFILLLCVSIFAEDFITKMEYAKLLYRNPRGIGCNLCHGNRGQGSIISRYKVKGKKKILKAPAINNLDLQEFSSALKITHKVMPTYYLTNHEISILYFYVTSGTEKD